MNTGEWIFGLVVLAGAFAALAAGIWIGHLIAVFLTVGEAM